MSEVTVSSLLLKNSRGLTCSPELYASILRKKNIFLYFWLLKPAENTTQASGKQ